MRITIDSTHPHSIHIIIHICPIWFATRWSDRLGWDRKMMTRRSASSHAAPLDKVGTINRTQSRRLLRKSGIHLLKRKTLGNTLLTALVSVALATSTAGQSYADTSAASSINAYKLYAHSRIYDFTQFICFTVLIDRESHWNPRAVNGHHYGMVQGNSYALRSMDAYTQIDWAIKYIHHRYNGSECRALHHSNVFGWY